ncbi:hypothetical protein BDQ12DRAFT_41811 [Crucibulum laeve]|uniref:F-box domain-containing protein n=1 Tax=Crucibulum laeve TaxID=68775 RepID=A0A5C3MHL4_9AGAR|nr:hypothetical protein BDQ12DRAFT_41811 [Crucibulum laeve]
MATLTLTANVATRRNRSLSLIAMRSPALFTLPAELIINILELALTDTRPRYLAFISKLIHHFVNAILYRTVVLDSATTIGLFHRTVTSKSLAPCHVRRLVILGTSESILSSKICQLHEIVAACPNLRTLDAPSLLYTTKTPVIKHFITANGPMELTLQTFEDPDNTPHAFSLLHMQGFASVTHLRICEPSDTWSSPLSIVATFRYLPSLTHLQLSRRTNSNEDNDAIFTKEVHHLLETRRALKMLVISVFNSQTWLSSATVVESNIWTLVSPIRASDRRLVLLEGEYDAWKEEWGASRRSYGGAVPTDFWKAVQRQVDLDVSIDT